jgi:hypothetical protein
MPRIHILENVTPSPLRCGAASCPSVHQLSDGNLLIVGKKLPPTLLAEASHLIGDGEQAVILGPDYFTGVVGEHSSAAPPSTSTQSSES